MPKFDFLFTKAFFKATCTFLKVFFKTIIMLYLFFPILKKLTKVASLKNNTIWLYKKTPNVTSLDNGGIRHKQKRTDVAILERKRKIVEQRMIRKSLLDKPFKRNELSCTAHQSVSKFRRSHISFKNATQQPGVIMKALQMFNEIAHKWGSNKMATLIFISAIIATARTTEIEEIFSHTNKEDFAFRHVGSTVHALTHASIRINVDIAGVIELTQVLQEKVKEIADNYRKSYKKASPFMDKTLFKDTNKTIRELEKRLNEAVKRLQFYHSLKDQVFNLKSGGRNKRFIFTLTVVLATLAVGAAVTAFGMYHYSEISRLERDSGIIARDAATIGDAVVNNSRRIDELEMQAQELTAITQETDVHLHTQKAIATIQAAIARVDHRIQNIAMVIAAMASKHVAPSALEALDLKEVARQAEEQATSKGFKVLINHSMDLIQCRSSFISTETGYALFIHLPLAREDTLMQVYQFVPLPIPVHDKLHLAIDSSKDVIAINNEKTRFSAMSSTDLAACEMIGQFYFCNNNNVARKSNFNLKGKDEDMCLLALHAQRIDTIKSTCKWRINVLENIAIQLSPKRFVMYNEQPHQGRLHCPQQEGSPDRTFTAHHTTTLEIPADCFLETDSHILYGAEELFSREWDVTWSWPTGLDDITEGINFTEVHRLTQQLDSPLANKSHFTLDNAIASLKHMPHRAPLSTHMTSWFALVSTPTVFLLMILGTIAVTAWCMQGRNKSPGIATAPQLQYIVQGPPVDPLHQRAQHLGDNPPKY